MKCVDIVCSVFILKSAPCVLLQMTSEIFFGRLRHHAEVKTKTRTGATTAAEALLDYSRLSLPINEASAFSPRWMLIFTFDSDMP